MLHVRPHGAVDALYLRIRRFDKKVLVRRGLSTAVTKSEVSGRKAQRRSGEDIPGPRTSISWHEQRIDVVAPVNRLLRADEYRVTGSRCRIVTARHVDIDIAETALGEMRFQCRERFTGRHVRNETKVEFRDGFARKNGFAARPGVSTDQSFDVHRRLRHQQFEGFTKTDVAYPPLDTQLLFQNILVHARRGIPNHLLLGSRQRTRFGCEVVDGWSSIRIHKGGEGLHEVPGGAIDTSLIARVNILFRAAPPLLA